MQTSAPPDSQDFVIPHKAADGNLGEQHQGRARTRGLPPRVQSSIRGRGALQVAGGGNELQHKSLVKPVFLAYGRVSGEGQRHTLLQIATAILMSLGDDMAVDAVQLMRTGWWIYLRTHADRARLVAQGLTLAGKHIMLRSEFHATKASTAKVTLRDLPLHMVDNEQVLAVMNECCSVKSEVFYGTVWHEGSPTSICNGDRYLYVTEESSAKLPERLEIAGVMSMLWVV